MDRPDQTCPRCGSPFDCRLDDADHCACADIDLTAELTRRINAEWGDCLCANCLRELVQAEEAAASAG